MIAQKWSKLVKSWNILRYTFAKLNMMKPIDNTHLKRKIYIVFFTFLAIGIIDHLIYLFRRIDTLGDCPGMDSKIEIYFLQTFPQFFHVYSYNIFAGFFVLIMDTFSSFSWSFADQFLMIISILIAHEFEMFNRKISLNVHNKSQQFWTEHWQAYQQMCKLLDQLNSFFGGLIIMSFATNLYFVCFELLHSFQ